MLEDIIPSKYRKIVYALYALTGVVIGSITVAYQAAEAVQPMWLAISIAVYAYLGTAFGSLAGGNIHDRPELPVE